MAGLSRIYNHMLCRPFAVISAERSEHDPRENARRTQELRQRLRSLGYGFAEAQVVWADDPDGPNPFFTIEAACFVPNIRREDAHAIRRAFDQRAVLFGEDGRYTLLLTAPHVPIAHLPIAQARVSDDQETEFFTEFFDVAKSFHITRPERGEPCECATRIGNREFVFHPCPDK